MIMNIPLQQQIALGFLASDSWITLTWMTLILMQESTRLAGIRRNIQFNYDDCTAFFQRGLKIQGPVMVHCGNRLLRRALTAPTGVFSRLGWETLPPGNRAVVGTLEDHVTVVAKYLALQKSGRVTHRHVVGM